LIVGGILNNPIEYADVIMSTTHKALAGPRGAILLTTDPKKAELINRAVFPGEQGGPHVNNIAAQAVCFNIAATDEFREYARTVAANAKYFSEVSRELGLDLAYGGTESHLFLIDLKCLGKKNGYYVTGELATRILDQCGITVNKNTISGDDNATHPTGIRIGTPWITQRGFSRENIRVLANIIYKILSKIIPFHYVGQVDDVGRGKIPLEVLMEAKKEVAALLLQVDSKPTEYSSGYPHYLYPEKRGGISILHDIHVEAGAEMSTQHGWRIPSYTIEGNPGTVLLDAGCNKIIRLRGDQERLRPFLQQVATGNMLLEIGQCKRTFLLNGRANVIDDILVNRVGDEREGFATYLIETSAMNGTKVLEWLRGLADGYIIFDEDDIYAKVEGPVVVEDLQTDADRSILRTCLLVSEEKGRGKLFSAIPGINEIQLGRLEIFEIDGLEVMVSKEAIGDVFLNRLYVHPHKAALLWKYIQEKVPGIKPGGFDLMGEYRKRAGLPDYITKITAYNLYNERPENFDITKPYFIGGKTLMKDISISSNKKKWEWVPGESGLKRTPLYEEHVRLGGRIVPFVGWEMPVQYEGISEEHLTVRTTAGLFDVSHMGVLEFTGSYAADFLDMMTSNYVRWIVPGETQYAYILGPDGEILDDIFIYRRSRDRFMMVVNAANAEKIWSWVNALNSNSYVIDNQNPGMDMPPGVRIRDLKAPSSGKDMKIDLAFQGPKSLNVLLEVIDREYRRKLECLEKAKFMEARLSGIEVIIARTGYTGEKIGFEIFVHPDDAVTLWKLLLEHGKKYGVKATGLGARDSTRTEAGFPLYGHEIEGPLGVFPMENGYAQFLKLHKPFFIGRHKALEMAQGVKMDIARFRMNKPNVKMLHTGDPVSNRRGQCIGYVSSSVLVGDHQIGLAYIRCRDSRYGAKVNIFPLPHGRKAPNESPRDQWKVGNKTIIPEEATILSRFPEEDEMLDRARTILK
jgi:glycine cleavage system T protein